MSEAIYTQLDDIGWTPVQRQRNADGSESVVRERWPIMRPDFLSAYVHYEPGMVVRRHGHRSNHVVSVLEGGTWLGEWTGEDGATGSLAATLASKEYSTTGTMAFGAPCEETGNVEGLAHIGAAPTDPGRFTARVTAAGFRVRFEGSVREAKPRLRISARLVDAESGNHLWAERYDLEMTEVFALQDAIAERVAGAIEPELVKTEAARAVARHTGNMTAWDLVRQGTWHFHQVKREGHLRAQELFRQACALDPELPEAHIWAARVSAGIVAYGWSSDPAGEIRGGLESGRKAVKLDDRNPYSHYALAIVAAYSSSPDQAIPAAEEAVAISPSFALGHLVLGMARLYCGRPAEAIAPLEHGLRLNPHDPRANVPWA